MRELTLVEQKATSAAGINGAMQASTAWGLASILPAGIMTSWLLTTAELSSSPSLNVLRYFITFAGFVAAGSTIGAIIGAFSDD